MKQLTLALALAVTCMASMADDQTLVRRTVEALLPGQPILAIDQSPLAGISEVTVGMNVFYVSADGNYLLAGPLLAADGRNLTATRVAAARGELLESMSDTPVFRYPADPVRHEVTVVTDIDCPYCRRLHNDLPEYATAGIDVEYIMLPRAGKASASYKKTVSAACADDPESAITAAMRGEPVAPADCDNPIDEHMQMARSLGVTSTPTIILSDGRVVLGHKKARELLAIIDR